MRHTRRPVPERSSGHRPSCVAVDKNSEGIPSPGQAVMCYPVRTTSGTPAPQKHLPNTLYTTHQFGSDALEVFGPRELCVPSTIQ